MAVATMADDDNDARKISVDQVQKQKEALLKAKSVVQRPVTTKAAASPPANTAPPPQIVTYPEFAPSQTIAAPPLVTLRRLLLTLYLSAGTAATCYILSKVKIFKFLLNGRS
jgi:hypothetical protein